MLTVWQRILELLTPACTQSWIQLASLKQRDSMLSRMYVNFLACKAGIMTLPWQTLAHYSSISLLGVNMPASSGCSVHAASTGFLHALLPSCCSCCAKTLRQFMSLHCIVQIYSQSGEDGAISTVRAATDPSLTGQGFKYLGPWYTSIFGAPLVVHRNNESKPIHQNDDSLATQRLVNAGYCTCRPCA